VGAYEVVLDLIERTLPLLPGDKTKDRAEALATRAQAFWGLGRIDDAKAAWKGAVQRYEELGDTKAAAAIHARLGHFESRDGESNAAGAEPAPEPVEKPVAVSVAEAPDPEKPEPV
jgi:hypothetical protein